jgi:hypothetical protein
MRLTCRALFAWLLTVAAVGHAQSPAPPDQAPAGFDLVAAENGGRVEWATAQYRPAMNLIGRPGRSWGGSQGAVHEIVFSFFGRQSALIGSVLVNPMTNENNDRPKDIEIWTSAESATSGFSRVASGSLVAEDALQAVEFPAVEGRFVKLRIVSTVAPIPGQKPGGFLAGASRVRILEADRPGYVSLLARNPALAAIAKGAVPSAPEAAAGTVPPAEGLSTCALPAAEAGKNSRFPQSKKVLVVTEAPIAFRAISWAPSINHKPQEGSAVVAGVTFTWMTPWVVAPAHLISEDIDTVVFAQVCEVDADVSSAFKQALLAWVAAGHKLIIQDSDLCAGHRSPKYAFMPYPLATLNPGAFGASGSAGVLENSTLASASANSPHFIDTQAWLSGSNDLGDSNIMIQYDARWCGAMWAKNRLKKNGMALAYAHYGRGLIIYDGYDADQNGNAIYRKLVSQELLQPFDPDYLPCTQALGQFIITTTADQKSRPISPGRTFTYPISVLGNFGYSGRVALDVNVMPADAGLSAKLDSAVADLSSVDESTTVLTVTASPTASLKSKVVAVRGRDSAGTSNILCLNLPERATGSLSVVSLLRADRPDRKPTKNLEIILDASGSMKAALGKRTRWATAQTVLKDVVSKLPADFSVGLRAYGHTLPSTNPGTCTDTALVVPVARLDAPGLLAAAGKLAPRGETPLVYSTLQTIGDLKALGGGTVVLITDGEESCKGDFAAAAKALKDSGLNLTLNIVGFTLKSAAAQAALSGLAESTGGHYYTASNGDALARAVLLASLDQLPYRILDAAAREVARGEAGGAAHELAPGNYAVVITAADREVRTPVSIAVGQDLTLRARVKGDALVVEP